MGWQESLHCAFNISTEHEYWLNPWTKKGVVTNLPCNALTTTSRLTAGNIVVSWLISASVGTGIPEFIRSALPVNSSTHSLITELLEMAALSPTPTLVLAFRILRELSWVALLEVVTTSSFPGVTNLVCCAWKFSGNALVDRRGARSEPTNGRMIHLDNATTGGESRYVLKLAISER